MKKNEGTIDRALRVALGIVLLIVGFGVVGGTGGTILGIVGLIPLVTGLVGWCPIYSIFKLSTTEDQETANA